MLALTDRRPNRFVESRLAAGRCPSRRRSFLETLEDRRLLSAIIADAFSGTNGAALSGRAPDTTNLPGSAWTVQAYNSNGSFSGSITTSGGDPAPAALFNCAGNSGGVMAISIASQGSYTKPQQFTVSTDIGPGSSNRTVGLGFYSAMGGATVQTNFTGLALSLSSRSLTLYQNGVAGASVAFTGTWDAGVYHKLSYTVDTATGAISAVTLEGSTSNYAYTSTAFSNSATAYAGAMTIGGDRDKANYWDNFKVDGVETVVDVVTDGFSGSGAIAGRTPDGAHLPNSTWAVQPYNSNGSFGASIAAATGDPAPSALFNCAGNSGGVIAISLASQGSYSKPSILTLSADLKGDTSRSMGLGYYSALGGATVTTSFTGLLANWGSGALTLYQNGVAGTSIAFTGTWNSAVFHTLSYTVDTTTGAISNVSFTGSTSNYAYTSTAFTASATVFAAAMTTYGNRDQSLYVDDFQVRGGSGGVTPSPLTDTNPFSIATSSNSYGSYATWMPQAAAAGVKWFRGFPEWGNIEPTNNTWDFTGVESLLDAADANGMYVSGFLAYAASWLGIGHHVLPVNNLADWSDYVTHVVDYTEGRMNQFEVWNEPNSPAFASNGTPANYASTVVAAYDAAKAANPDVMIGLQVADFDVNYLEQTIMAGAAGHYDYITVHPYSILGTLNQGYEAVYINIVKDIRKMLQAKDPSHANVPIWITEVGAQSGSVGETGQAQYLMKAYIGGLAGGVSRISWYEGKEGDGTFGIIRADGTVKPAYTALQNMTARLGGNPQYTGWLQFNSRDYGFVFQGASTSVMALWAPPGVTDSVTFSSAVQILNPLTGGVTNLAAGSPLTLTNDVQFVLGVPSSLVSQAATNKTQPLPWGGDYSAATSVILTAGSPSTEAGLHHLSGNSTSTAAQVDGVWARNCSQAAIQTFTVDPNFLSYTPTNIQITAVLRRVGPASAGFNLKYESTSGWASPGWYTVPSGSQWFTQTWTLSTDEFNSNWGYNFKFDSDSTTYSQYYIRSVTVAKVGGLSAASPALEGSGAAALQGWQLKPVIAAAKRLWTWAGANPAELRGVRFIIDDLPGDLLGTQNGKVITLDTDAAGYGWSTSLRRPAAGRMDLLTTVSHELGHCLSGRYPAILSQPLMAESLESGMRLLPQSLPEARHEGVLRGVARFSRFADRRLKDLLGSPLHA